MHYQVGTSLKGILNSQRFTLITQTTREQVQNVQYDFVIAFFIKAVVCIITHHVKNL